MVPARSHLSAWISQLPWIKSHLLMHMRGSVRIVKRPRKTMYHFISQLFVAKVWMYNWFTAFPSRWLFWKRLSCCYQDLENLCLIYLDALGFEQVNPRRDAQREILRQDFLWWFCFERFSHRHHLRVLLPRRIYISWEVTEACVVIIGCSHVKR